MTPYELAQAVRSGQTVLGTLIVSPSPRWPDSLRNCGLDFVFIDTEHIALDRADLSWMCQAYSAIGLPPLVRIPSPDPYSATMVLDGGAAGIIAPYVETAEQAKALSGAVKKRPIKGQKLHRMLDGHRVEADLESYVEEGAKNRLLIVNIESKPAMEGLDAILAVPGLDGVLIGPHDLSCSLGLPEQYDHPDFLAACESITRQARAAGVGAGIHFWGSVEQHTRFLEMGVNLLIHSADISLFQKHLRLELSSLRQSAGLFNQSNRTDGQVTI